MATNFAFPTSQNYVKRAKAKPKFEDGLRIGVHLVLTCFLKNICTTQQVKDGGVLVAGLDFGGM